MSELSDFRKAKDKYFGGDENSPLTPEQRKGFQGLQYFAENERLRFVLEVEEFSRESKDEIQMATSTGDSAPHTRWGQLKFEVDCVPQHRRRRLFPSFQGRHDGEGVLFRRPLPGPASIRGWPVGGFQLRLQPPLKLPDSPVREPA